MNTEVQGGKRKEIAGGKGVTGEENHCEQPVLHRSIAPIVGGAICERETLGLLSARLQAHGFKYRALDSGILSDVLLGEPGG